MSTTETGRQLVVSAYVTCNTGEEAVRATEALQRVVTGLALDGLDGSVSIYQVDEDGERER